MPAEENTRIRSNGIFYTPRPLARLLASRSNITHGISILDPACGNGSLLRAALECAEHSPGLRRPRLLGYDRFAPEEIDPQIQFIHSDFFSVEVKEKHDLILTNPPYVQSAKIPLEARSKYHADHAESLGFSRNLDLWGYFLLKCVRHLREDGAIAAVLPWSFLEAEYAQRVREWLADSFGQIEVLVLEGAHFPDTVKRVCLVWLREYGRQAATVQIAHSDTCSGHVAFRHLPLEAWSSSNVLASADARSVGILEKLGAAGFVPLEEHADISIGIVTGANDYFILRNEEAISFGFSDKAMVPILTTVEDLGQVLAGKTPDKKLIQFNRMTAKREKYVSRGVRRSLHKRSHCHRREGRSRAWYDVQPGRVPDAFFTYRVSTFPYMILNPDGYRCTNALHAISFRETAEAKRKWIQLSLLSFFGQFSLELAARHYGNGLMKVEPKVLKQALVFAGERAIPRKEYHSILRHIAEGDKELASIEATKLIVREAGIADSVVRDVLTMLNGMRNRRGAQPICSQWPSAI